MKKIHFYIILVFISILSIVSCKRYLALEPTTSFSEVYVFNNTSNATNAVLGVYNRLTGDYGWGGRLNYYFSNDCDETLGTMNSSSGGGDNSNKAIARYNALPTNTQLEPVYNQLYQGIERANMCIKNIPKMDLYLNGSEADKILLKRLYGEALTLRAEFFFDLIKHWGDVPAPFIPSADQPDINLPKTDRDTIYNHILEDLKLAATLVPWRGEGGIPVDERITKGAVKGLRARIALFRGGFSLRRSGKMERTADYLKYYQITKDECNDIMQSGKHKLNPSFMSVFKDNLDAHDIEPNGEVLFEIELAGGTGLTDGKIGNIDGIRVNGKGQGSIFILPTYFYLFDSTDLRRDVTIATYNINASGAKVGNAVANTIGMMLAKFRRDWITNPEVPASSAATYHGVNWPLIRYSDVLLMFAEAENELNASPTAEGIDAFKQVRKRGFNNDETKIGVIPTTKDAFFNAIVKERSLELGGEAVRKYDLIRWNLIASKLAEAKANLALFRISAAPYNKLPLVMYFKNNSTDLVWYSSYYTRASVTATPAGYTSMNWTSGVTGGMVDMVAEKFVANHSELLPLPQTAVTNNPNLKQDYGY